MRRIHIALAVGDLESTVRDYTNRLGAPPVAVVAGKFALWRTKEVNLSVNSCTEATARLRHLGFEDDSVLEESEEIDVNGVMWEAFSPAWQDEGIVRLYGPPDKSGA
jgi:catechol 2,3-dioxygenase-like lactoylglutathione lyase family enzyme